jgi:hypothetical protein
MLEPPEVGAMVKTKLPDWIAWLKTATTELEIETPVAFAAGVVAVMIGGGVGL